MMWWLYCLELAELVKHKKPFEKTPFCFAKLISVILFTWLSLIMNIFRPMFALPEYELFPEMVVGPQFLI